MPVIVRNYRKYKDWKMPIITLGLKYNENWYPVDAYVDSGAIYSIFRQTVGERMDIEIDKGKLIYSQVGDSGSFLYICMRSKCNWGQEFLKPPSVSPKNWASGLIY